MAIMQSLLKNLNLEHQYLLKFLYSSDVSADILWKKWLNKIDFEDLDGQTYQLLPNIHRKLIASGIQTPLLPRIKGVQRLSWCKNQTILLALRSLFQFCHESKVPIVWLNRGLWQAENPYDKGLAPIRDLRFQIHLEHCTAIATQLQQLGWKSNSLNPLETLRWAGCLWFIHDTYPPLLLYRQLSHWSPSPAIVQKLWERSIAYDLDGNMGEVSSRTWSLTDQILYRVVAMVDNRESLLLDFVELIALLQASEVDGQDLLKSAIQYKLLAPLQLLFSDLRQLEISLPDCTKWSNLVESAVPTRLEQWETMFVVNQNYHLMARIVRRYVQYQRQASVLEQNESWLAFLQFLRDSWQIKSIFTVVPYGLQRQLGHFWRRLRNNWGNPYSA